MRDTWNLENRGYAMVGVVVACSRLRDGGGKSFSSKKCEKRAGAVPSRARLIFALLLFVRSHYTIREPGTG